MAQATGRTFYVLRNPEDDAYVAVTPGTGTGFSRWYAAERATEFESIAAAVRALQQRAMEYRIIGTWPMGGNFEIVRVEETTTPGQETLSEDLTVQSPEDRFVVVGVGCDPDESEQVYIVDAVDPSHVPLYRATRFPNVTAAIQARVKYENTFYGRSNWSVRFAGIRRVVTSPPTVTRTETVVR